MIVASDRSGLYHLSTCEFGEAIAEPVEFDDEASAREAGYDPAQCCLEFGARDKVRMERLHGDR